MSESFTTQLHNYPFLSLEDFKLVCEAFVSLFHRAKKEEEDWDSVSLISKQGDESYIRISRRIPAQARQRDYNGESNSKGKYAEATLSTEDFEESDDEALSRQKDDEACNSMINIADYDILFSPSYRVPVLYFSVKDSAGQSVTDIDTLYDLLIPPAYKAQVRDVGIIGGITIANHPITDIPVFFIHPCQTADALYHVAGDRSIPVDEYLLVWMGVIGASIGLNAPLSIVREKKQL